MKLERQRCGVEAHAPAMCSQRGVYGHPACLNLEYFQGYPFCGYCTLVVIRQYGAYEDSLRREQWRRSLGEQISTWKHRATQAMGVSAYVGVALGGAAASAAGAAVVFAQGVVRGTREGSASSKALM